MQLSDLTYYTVEYMGDAVDGFDINARYHGYTRDRRTFHVYDEQSNSYRSYSDSELDAALRSGYFNQSNPVTTTNQGNVNSNNYPVTYYEQTSSWGAKEYLFIGVGFIMLFYFAYQGSRG